MVEPQVAVPEQAPVRTPGPRRRGAERPIPREMDITRPCAARVHNAFLGGGHNFGVDREFAERVENSLPGASEIYLESREFLRRTVEQLLASGLRQFLDLGSGIPTIGHVHEVAARHATGHRVLYVDNEPLTVAHTRPVLAGEPMVDITEADLRCPDTVLARARQLLDLDQPVALLMSAVLHFVPDADDPRSLVRTYRDVLAPGSHLVITHATGAACAEQMRVLEALYATTSDPLTARDTAWIEELFGDFELLSPGSGYVSDWRPEHRYRQGPARYPVLFGGVARKTGPGVR